MHAGLLGKLRGKLELQGRFALIRLAELAREAISNGLSLELDEDTIVETAKAAFDKYIRPVDWPFVSEPTETKLEDQAWAWCEATIRAAIKD